jgi:nicotinamide mononucleotide (NMN) deamidase PncC
MSLTSEVSSMVMEVIRTLEESNETLATAESITAAASAAVSAVASAMQEPGKS